VCVCVCVCVRERKRMCMFGREMVADADTCVTLHSQSGVCERERKCVKKKESERENENVYAWD